MNPPTAAEAAPAGHTLPNSPQTPIAGGAPAQGRSGRRRGMLLPVVVLTLVSAACLLAPVISPYSPTAISNDLLEGPDPAHLLGTDEIGRDLLTRILHGGALSLVVAGSATALSILIGTAWGFAAALGRGWIDELLMRLADIAMAVPSLLLALVFVAAFGASQLGLALVIGLLLAPASARMVRAVALTEITAVYSDAALAYGASRLRLVVRELLPNMVVPIGVQVTVNAAHAIVIEASLSFIGLGVQPPQTSWGTLVRQGYDQLYHYAGYAIFPGITVVVVIWALNAIGDRLDDDRAGTARLAG